MKKIKSNLSKYLLIIGIATVSMQSCANKDFGDDYNKNDYGAYSSDYKGLMAGAISQVALRGGNNFYMKPILFAQYQSQVLYTSESLYNQEGGAWDWYYARCINSLDKIIADYSKNPTAEMLQQGSAENMIGVSKIFRAIVYKRITDTYGDIPYSEAAKMQEGIKTPKFDSQESIYKSLISELKAGRDMLDDTKTAPKGDVLYAGTSVGLKKWKKLANSVILQASLQLSKKYPSASDYAATEFKGALANSAGVIEAIADEAWYTYNIDAAVTNPLYAFRAADYRLSAQLVESLKGSTSQFNVTSNHTSDARRSVYASSNTLDGLPYGYNTTDLETAGYSSSSKAQISSRFRTQTAPMNLMTAGYTFLNRAEAAALGWTTENVTEMLEKGITLNYQTLDSHYATTVSSSASTYAVARKADVATFGAKRVIGEEKWIALFNNGFDAWAEFRRTGYPNLKPAPSALNGGVIPRRLQYPVNEQVFNAINYKDAVAKLAPGQDLNTSKVWWDQ